MKHSFDIKTSVDFFHALEEFFSEYVQEPKSSRKAIVCAIFCWQLTDWVYREYEACGLKSKFGGPNNFKSYITSHSTSINIIRDIANGSKHFQPSDLKTSIAGTEVSNGRFSLFFSTAFDTTGLRIYFEDGTYKRFDIEMKEAIRYWRQFFQAELSQTV